MKRYAPAKVNIALDVLGVDARGYHDLDMIMAPISLFDEVEIEPAARDVVEFVGMDVPEANTVRKAMDVMREQFGFSTRFFVRVVKRIPEQAGLAGGSADAAAVMKAIVELEGLNVSLERLMELGAKVGADVPFCLLSRWARVQGIGERVVPIESDWRFFIVLVKPAQGVSTPRAFARWDEGVRTRMDVDRTQAAVERNDLDALMASVCNALEGPAIELVPAVEQVRQDLLAQGVALARMTGSGSAVMGFSRDKSVLERAAKSLRTKYPFVEIVQVG
ncbi:4-(cytidine 5'-diphospho)-2-C-methyl-D-erythritol kinase [uncultured Dubosiella sp.]|uniref:4-(cytidine 5'-diphospho)-2-C-methyl-D-erythritol kinase n=1 Tax=uncultured Dubosiella sp. TaxID=1937011 RepID=UPI0027312C36|nr:4-(cytidine 5'-diphospho)-2-C-methyl-D-erythritol kinase [uncultured Dubosiella sp.]